MELQNKIIVPYCIYEMFRTAVDIVPDRCVPPDSFYLIDANGCIHCYRKVISEVHDAHE